MVSGNNTRRVNNLSLAARADILVRLLRDECNFYLSDISDVLIPALQAHCSGRHNT